LWKTFDNYLVATNARNFRNPRHFIRIRRTRNYVGNPKLRWRKSKRYNDSISVTILAGMNYPTKAAKHAHVAGCADLSAGIYVS
jgi:hypothetical protein